MTFAVFEAVFLFAGEHIAIRQDKVLDCVKPHRRIEEFTAVIQNITLTWRTSRCDPRTIDCGHFVYFKTFTSQKVVRLNAPTASHSELLRHCVRNGETCANVIEKVSSAFAIWMV